MTEMAIGSYDLKVESDSNALQCHKCEKWIHNFCTQLPPYFIVLLAGSTITFICETLPRYVVRGD